MNEFVGKIKERMTLSVTYVKSIEWEQDKYTGWGTETMYRHIFKDCEDNTLLWKTSNPLGRDVTDEDGYIEWESIPVGSVISIKGTVKNHTTYKDTNQTELTRVNILQIEKKALTKEEKEDLKKKEQLAYLSGKDFVWNMPYKQFREHYADCETVAGSFDRHLDSRGVPMGCATIEVIIREGRLKNSGVRGEHFSGYSMKNELGEKVVYRAVNEDNALKRVNKEYPNHTWECIKVYDYHVDSFWD